MSSIFLRASKQKNNIQIISFIQKYDLLLIDVSMFVDSLKVKNIDRDTLC